MGTILGRHFQTSSATDPAVKMEVGRFRESAWDNQLDNMLDDLQASVQGGHHTTREYQVRKGLMATGLTTRESRREKA